MRVLELYSGIGGMHYALKESGISYELLASVDINTAANEVYKHNFPTTLNISRNIQSFEVKDLKKWGIDSILMSPPCQPFTRVGLKKDVLDERTDSFLHVLRLIPEIDALNYILLENVKGFETSQARDKLVECIIGSGFSYQEFILSPCQFGVPNTRHRYYLIAKKKALASFCFSGSSSLLETLPKEFLRIRNDCRRIGEVLEDDIEESEYLIPDKILEKHSSVLDIQTPASNRSCCFTKAYSRYVEGTGSVLCPFSEEIIARKYSEARTDGIDVNEKIEVLRGLKLRYFTPREISRLMCFPESFQFPQTITKKQKYRLLGNSINIYVVSQLIRLLKLGDNQCQT